MDRPDLQQAAASAKPRPRPRSDAPQPLQGGLVATALGLFALPLGAWLHGIPAGALLLLAGGWCLYAMNRRSRRLALLLLGGLAALATWWLARG
ncbi:MAG TPA: hypothetical protein VIX81_11985 [Gammaproteobacteria bacterium]